MLNILGFSLQNLRKYEDSIEYFDQAIRLSPNNSEAYKNKGTLFNDEFLGFSLYRLCQYEYAINCFDEAIRQNPYNSESYNYKGIFVTNL